MPERGSQFAQQERILYEAGIKASRLMSGLDDQLWDRIRKYLRRMDVKDGRFATSQSSTQVIAEIRRELSSMLRQTQVTEFMRELTVDFDGLSENLRWLHKEENGLTVPRSLVTEQKARAIDEMKNSLFESGYDARFAEPVQKALFNAVNFGADVVETEKALKTLVYGVEGKAGMMQRHAGTVARDTLRGYRGRLNKVIELENDLKFTRYVGNVIADSRWQCRRWVEMEYISNADLAKEVRLAFRRGSGMIPGTTKDTFIFIYCGGYNCLHTAFPVRQIEKR